MQVEIWSLLTLDIFTNRIYFATTYLFNNHRLHFGLFRPSPVSSSFSFGSRFSSRTCFRNFCRTLRKASWSWSNHENIAAASSSWRFWLALYINFILLCFLLLFWRLRSNFDWHGAVPCEKQETKWLKYDLFAHIYKIMMLKSVPNLPILTSGCRLRNP